MQHKMKKCPVFLKVDENDLQ
uniref:Uncharacterized protein n=1 Tax=Anguilla anguilla TaxID=7936 RepID=A0A0E9UE86_ANGAN